VRVVDGVTLSLEAGRTLGLVGESGSGKSLTALSIARLVPSPPARHAGGRIFVEGEDVYQMTEAGLRRMRGGTVAYVFQEPASSLNPTMRIGRQILESLSRHAPDRATMDEVIQLLNLVGIPNPSQRIRAYPHELSGGMQQRVMIAMAVAPSPKLLVADEPTTALDTTIQAQILHLLIELQRQLGMAILLISHNLGLVAQIAHSIAVMYAGEIVERGPTERLLRAPAHPYTKALLALIPTFAGAKRDRFEVIPGAAPLAGDWPAGCRFHPRCPFGRSECARIHPALQERTDHQSWYCRCPYHFEIAQQENGRGAPAPQFNRHGNA
jgi:oligopeptide/dipeptide ABC transporter ATP-binding protein